ncbi:MULTISPECIES: hypothetical protein [unclassified Nocardia]|uniref:hypothetical protein n=1 Tax=unclassified Nocardia TaxID=2637762 RepID=UPI00278C3621|nr:MULTISPECIES: hypothetical protein [unclassified Nocardia]
MQLVTTAEWNLTGTTHGTLRILGYHARIRPVAGTTSLRWSVVRDTPDGLERVDDGASLDIADAQDECEEAIREHRNLGYVVAELREVSDR